ncbi:NYN domain-containing protein [Spongorhabdus nitratireducens]
MDNNNTIQKPDSQGRIAILFDAENISPRHVDTVVKKTLLTGQRPIIRAYADFSRPHTRSWEAPARRHGLRTIHQFSQGSGNSSSDFLMMYDAFKLLHSGKVQHFVIVTHDSDFATPILLIRQSGGYVHGYGELGRTPEALPEACDTFTNIRPASQKGHRESPNQLPMSLIKNLTEACRELSPDNQWLSLSKLGQSVEAPLQGEGYRFKNLSRMVKATGAFETDETRANQYVRLVSGL